MRAWPRALLLLLSFLLVWGCARRGQSRQEAKPPPKRPAKVKLLCYSANLFLRAPMEEIGRLFERRTGIKVDFDFGEGGTLFAKVEISRKGDVFVCHDPFLALVKKRGFCDRYWTIAWLRPVIVVRKGNPKGIRGLKDLFKPGVRVGLPDFRHSTAGYILKYAILKKAGLLEKAEKMTAYFGHHADTANSVAIGALDAGIVWDAVARARSRELDIVEIEPEYQAKPGVDTITTATYGEVDLGYTKVTAITLKFSKHLKEAREFAKFIASPEGIAILKRHGLTPPLEAQKAAK